MRRGMDGLREKKKMLRVFDKTDRYWKRVLGRRFNEEDVTDIVERAREEYLSLIPRIPDIGGRSNPLAFNLIEAAVMLAYYKVLKKREMSLEEIGAVTHDVVRARVTSYPSLLLRLRGAYISSSYCQKKRRRLAIRSQNKEYPGDWVFSFVEGDGKTFHYGIDFSECGICKLFEAHDAREYTPFLCEIDYITFGAFGITLFRTKTLGEGDDVCNFRFMR